MTDSDNELALKARITVLENENRNLNEMLVAEKRGRFYRTALAEQPWEDVKDEWSAAIRAAHPIETDRHDLYATAMKMVSARHAKFELVKLVNWLLSRIDTLERPQ